MSYTSQIETVFSGPSVTSTSPPHNGLAVGPNNIVMVEGSRIEWTNLTGGSPTLQSTYNFFSSLSPTGGLYDQRAIYDSVNQRYVVIMQYAASGATISDIDIAVSKDSNPNDGWYFASLNTSLTINGQLTGSDRPMLTGDGTNLYITAAQFNVNVSGFVGTESWVIGDTAGPGGGLYNGGTLTVTANELTPSNQNVFTVAASSGSKTYYASDYSSGGQILLALQTYDKSTNTFGAISTLSLGNIDQGGAYTVQQKGTSLLLDAVDNRTANIVYANGFLYGVAEMKPIGSSVPLVHWFKVDVSNPNAPALVAQGDISGASIGTNVATFNSSIAVDAAGDVLINFTASGPNNYPSDYYVFQGAGDPTGSFSAPILYQASTGFFDSGDGASVQRWGLNSSTTVDPNNPNSFWLSNEYVANGWWQTSVAQVAIQNIGAPTVASIATSGTGITNGTGDLNAGKVITLTVNFSAAVTVTTTGGSPTLTLNDGGTATYTGGSGSTALTFSYTVAATQNTSDLVVSSFNLNGAIVKDGAGNAANLAGAISYNPAGTLQIDTAAPTVASIVPTGTGIINGSGNPSTGQVVTLTVNFSEPVTVNTTGGSPTLTLNDGGTATFTGGSGSTALTFSYTIAAGQTTPDLAISALNLNGAVVIDGAGNAATLTGATNYNPAGTLQINVTAPTFASIVPTGTGITSGSGDLNAGKVITLTANFSAAVIVNTTGGSPTLTLNDGGTATYVSGSGTTALTFSYTVAAAQNTADLVISSFNLNGATVKDGAGNAANLSGATNYNPAGTLQIDTTAPTVASIVPTGTGITNGTGNLGAGQAVTLTANFGEAVTVNTTGGSPTLTLNDGGTATYTGGSGTSALTFTYTAAAGQNTPDLSISSFNLNGATVIDGAGNAANLTGAANYNPSGSLKVNTTGVPNYSHIVVVVEENKNNDQITGNTAQAPFINSLMAGGASLTNFTAETHPSQPNYYALYAGSTFGIADDADGHSLPDPTLYTVLQNAGLTFKGYVDDSGTGNSSNHEPWTSFPEGRTVQTDFTTTFPSLFASGNYSSLPAVSFVIPNPQNDMHDGTVAQGDTWLQQNLGAYAQWALANNSLLVVTWDENDNEAVNQIPTLLYGANVAPGNYGAAYNHYNVLSTVLAPFGLTGPNNAATAAPIQVFGGGSAVVSSIATSGSGITSGTGNLNAGKTVTITVNFSAAVTVNTTGGSPTLTLNDGGTASYVSGSGSPALTFSYTVAAGQNTPDLAVSTFNLNGATVKDGAGNTADLSAATNNNPAGTLQIDTVAATVASIVASGPGITNGSGSLGTGQVVTLTVNMSEAVTINTTGGSPALTLNDGGTASYTGGSGSTALTFSYTVAAGQNTPDLVVSSFNLNGATATDGAGNVANLSGASNFNPAGTLQINTTAPTVSSIATSGTGITGGTGDLNAGKVITLTVNFSAAVTVNTTGGAPTLTLNDGGTASYVSGSGTAALTFSYTVAAGQNTPDLTVSTFNLNGATIKDGAGNTANLTGANNFNPAGTLQIDTVVPTVGSIVASGPGITNGSGNLGTGQVVTLTVNMSEAVTINTTGGSPTLTLNDGGVASYTGGSGTTALTFSYTVAAGQNTPDLVVSSFNLNGATATDGASNVANLSAATNYNPAGTLQIGTTAPALTISSITTSGTGITGGIGDLNTGKVVTITVNFSGAATVNTTGGTPTLTLNDGGTATYIAGSGTATLTFSYTVAAGQNTPDLVVSSFNLNGATVKDGGGNTADLSGATNNNPAGTLQIDTVAPVPTFSQEPPPVTSSSTAAFAFTTSNSETNGVNYAYKLDGATTWTAVTGNTLSLSGLANGSHAIQLQATDGAGNISSSPATYNWTIAAAVAQIETQFSGPSVTSTYPPNNGLAVGPNNVVMMEGSRIEWTNLAGGSPTLQSVYTFFSPLGSTAASSLNHPRAVYDSVNQRYIVVMDNSPSGHTISNIAIAVSKDSNPADGWYFSSLNTSLTINGQLTSADSPTVSVDGSNVYITTTQYNVNVSGTAGTEAWVIGDTAGAGGGIYNGGTLTVVASQLLPSSQNIFKVVAGNNGKTYYASSYSPGGSQVVVTVETYDAASNTFGPSTTLNLGNIDQGGAYTAQQLGTSLLLDASDKRLRNLAYANGFLYGVTEIKPIGSSVPLVHWFKIDVSNPNAPALVAQGDISGTLIGTNVATFNPSIAVDASGDVMINFTASGPNMYPGDYYVYQQGSAPAGSFSAPTLYQASTGFFNSGNGASVQPWGNYSSATVDPNNPNSFWISNEYVASNWWQTSVAQVAIETAEVPTLTVGNTSLTVTAGGSIPLGLTATPVDSDDTMSLTISGVPTYETITAPTGNTVTSSLQANGTNTWTITEGASVLGKPLTGLTLTSQYTGTDHPVATFTVTASNTTTGETATTAAQTITVTDPPAAMSAGAPSVLPRGGAVASTPNRDQIGHLAALMEQFTAAGFHEDHAGAGAITSTFGSIGGHESLAFLATPHPHHA